MDIWSINPVSGQFDDVGDMKVSQDGKSITTISGGVRNSSWHFTAPQPVPPQATNQNPDNGCPSCKVKAPGASEVELHSGALHEWHDLVPYNSLGDTQAISLHYKSDRANPQQSVFAGSNNLVPAASDRIVAASRFQGVMD